MSKRVIVAMSGGVDSSVAAAILREQGYDVIGIAMRLTPDAPASPGVVRRRGTCCSHEDFEDARRVAERLNFPFYVVDLREEFGSRVIGNFVSEYLHGRTPNPCVMCNREIKFDRLWQRARALGVETIATGHYARIEQDSSGRHRLLRATDESKDQSYFLFTLTQRELARTLFPLGRISKAEVRMRARELGLANAEKPESQEICFVPDNDYGRLVEQMAKPDQVRPGPIVDKAGHQLGNHQGIHLFTVGQRRGLGIASTEPLYVREIRPATREIVVGRRAEIMARGLIARSVSLTGAGHEAPVQVNDEPIEVKIRYRHPGIPATLRLTSNDRAEVRFVEGGPAVTPGQACVFYRGNEVLGGGFIERAIEA
ncbi:MAG TPA: tRNA 2-thiouridine(34) synthase MnmA [Candidatus Binataceae bacterium]|nr:tRNA 2-thiouridine(34) synthase MnmA [Candidatus Binataceae bacterium]